MNRLCTIFPSRTVTYSAAGALSAGIVSASYMSMAVCSSPKAAIRSARIRNCPANGPRNSR